MAALLHPAWRIATHRRWGSTSETGTQSATVTHMRTPALSDRCPSASLSTTRPETLRSWTRISFPWTWQACRTPGNPDSRTNSRQLASASVLPSDSKSRKSPEFPSGPLPVIPCASQGNLCLHSGWTQQSNEVASESGSEGGTSESDPEGPWAETSRPVNGISETTRPGALVALERTMLNPYPGVLERFGFGSSTSRRTRTLSTRLPSMSMTSRCRLCHRNTEANSGFPLNASVTNA